MFQKIETIWTLISSIFDWLLGFIMPTIFLTISFWLLFFEYKNIIYIILSVIIYLLYIVL